MAFGQKLLQIDWQPVKDWANNLFALKTHKHPEYDQTILDTTEDWSNSLFLEGVKTYNGAFKTKGGNIYKINAPGWLYLTSTVAEVDHDDAIVMVSYDAKYLYADDNYYIRQYGFELFGHPSQGYGHLSDKIYIVPGTRTYVRVATDNDGAHHSLIWVPVKGLTDKQRQGAIDIISAGSNDVRNFSRTQYFPRAVQQDMLSNIRNCFNGDWRNNFK